VPTDKATRDKRRDAVTSAFDRSRHPLRQTLQNGRDKISGLKDMADGDEMRHGEDDLAFDSASPEHFVNLAMPGPLRDHEQTFRRRLREMSALP
jgi:hypothetical protein